MTVESPLVMHVRTVTGFGGGPDKTILNSPRHLRRLDYESCCAYMHPPDDPGFEALRARALNADATIYSVPDRGPLDIRVALHLTRLCREKRVSVWHGHDYKSNALGLIIRRVWPMKLVTTVHGWGAQPTRRTVWYNGVDRFCLRYYDDVICVSEDLWTTCRRRGVLESRCHLVQNAIDTEIFRRASRPTTKQHGPLILGALGRLSSEKGFDLLVRAVVAMNQQGVRCQLRIGGDGTQRDNLESLIRELNCGENVKLLGHIHDVKSFIQGLDVFVLSSVSEGLPNVVLEAMAMEVPVAATRVAGVPQLIRDGENGVLVEPGSVIGLVDGVSRLFADSELRGRVAAAGRDTVVHSHSFDVRMRRIVDIYDQSLGRRPSSQHTRELA